ncbi:uncharacterized protein F5891DRAFT_970507, partial [Suillus fuscotomentosus]
RLEYLVHWKGYPREEREWLLASELRNAPQAIADFHRKHPAAPRPMPTMRLRFQALENLTVPTQVPC